MKIKVCSLLTVFILACGLLVSCHSKPEKARLTIYCTTDVHGTVFDYDLKGTVRIKAVWQTSLRL